MTERLLKRSWSTSERTSLIRAGAFTWIFTASGFGSESVAFSSLATVESSGGSGMMDSIRSRESVTFCGKVALFFFAFSSKRTNAGRPALPCRITSPDRLHKSRLLRTTSTKWPIDLETEVLHRNRSTPQRPWTQSGCWRNWPRERDSAGSHLPGTRLRTH